MNTEKLKLMSTMLAEVDAGDWKGIAPDTLINIGPVHLIGVPVKQFDLGNWVERNSRCGFSACAVGHAIYDQRFNDLGLIPSGGRMAPKFVDEDLETRYNWDAVISFFEINGDTALGLFKDNYYFTGEQLEKEKLRVTDPIMVKDRVDELLLIGEEAFNAKYKDLEAV